MSSLIEGLPNEVALRCLAFVPFFLLPKLELVSRSWKAAVRSVELFKARQEVGSLVDLLCVCYYDKDNAWQLYDPVQDLWITLPRLPTTRKQHFGVVSTSQKLFVLGGYNLILDPLTRVLDDDDICNEVWSFDPVTRNWSMRAPMLEARAQFACCVLDGKIIVAGGITGKRESTSKVEMYDSVKDLWVPLPDLPEANDSGTALMVGRKMHVFSNGPIVHTFDSLECRWSVDTVKIKDYRRFYLDCVAVAQDSLYIMTSEYIFKQDGQDYKVFVLASQFHGRSRMAMIYFGGKLYVIGGLLHHPSYAEHLSDVHVLALDSTRPTWFNAAPMSRGCGEVLGCAVLKL